MKPLTIVISVTRHLSNFAFVVVGVMILGSSCLKLRFVCFLEFYVLLTYLYGYRLVTVYTHGDLIIVLLDCEDQATGTMT